MEDPEQTTLTDNDAADKPSQPVAVLTSPNSGTVQPNVGPIPATLVAPQPMVNDPTAAPDGNDLPARIERALAQDGRFAPFLPGLIVTADADGTVHLSGRVPSEGQRQSLTTAVSALPGVQSVQDTLTVE